MSQNIQPGQYRSLEHYFRDLVYPFRQTEPRESKATNNSFHWGLRKFFPEMALAPSSEQKGQFSYAIPMDGIPREGWPKNQAFRDSMGFAQIRHTYPPTSIPYLEPMFEIYRELLKMPTGAKDPRVLENIARYYHYGINAHLFHRINNSLLMIQVNNFLELQGWRGGYHRDLDVYAVNMDFPSFFEKFRDWLKQANPE